MNRSSTRPLRGLLLWTLGLALLAPSTASAQPGPLPEPSPAAKPKPTPKRIKLKPPELRGVALTLHSKDPDFDYSPMLRELPDLGVNFVSVSVHVYQDHGDSLAPARHPTKTPSDGTIRRVLKEARRLGLEIGLLPIVLLESPKDNDWRGNIQPPDSRGRSRRHPKYGGPDWTSWFRGYRAVISHYARLAEECRASVFCLGSELSSTEGQLKEWQQVVREVRQRFSGELTYSANWDHYTHVPIWKELDFIGLSAYYELTKSKSPTLPELARSWRGVRKEILRWRKEAGLTEIPILFTEVGYPSINGGASKPWDYTQKTGADPHEQKLCYQAFVQTWNGRPELGGVIFYEWWGRGGPLDRGYTPRGKPALRVLRGWYSQGGRARKD